MNGRISRDRGATIGRLAAAVGALLVERGASSLGVNSVARRAGVDKALVYRYFGGFDGLLEHYAARADLWWPVDELLLAGDPPTDGDDLGGWLTLALSRHLEALRRRPAAVAILAAGSAAPSVLRRALEIEREARCAELLDRLQARFLGAPAGADVAATTAILLPALTQLVLDPGFATALLGEAADGAVAGERIDAALAAMVGATVPSRPR